MAESVPITLAGKDYELRFEPDDVEACESDLFMGYIFFFDIVDHRPVYLSFKQSRIFLHHGLRLKDTRGDLHYVFQQTPTGAKLAGELVQKAMQDDVAAMIRIWEAAHQAFVLGWFPKQKPKDDQTERPIPEESKN